MADCHGRPHFSDVLSIVLGGVPYVSMSLRSSFWHPPPGVVTPLSSSPSGNPLVLDLRGRSIQDMIAVPIARVAVPVLQSLFPMAMIAVPR